jgi:hypothetical protein
MIRSKFLGPSLGSVEVGMVSLDDVKALARPAKTKVVLVVMDGVGGLPRPFDGKTELEAAQMPTWTSWPPRGRWGWRIQSRPASRREADPGTSASSATIRSSFASGGAS